MHYLTIPPSAALRHIVRFYWILESDQPYSHHSMADMCVELLFHYNGRFNEVMRNGAIESSFTAGIHGQTAHTHQFHIGHGFGMFAAYLYPQAIPLLFGLPAEELTNQMPDLPTLLKDRGRQLEEAIALAPNHRQRILILEQFLAEQLAHLGNEQPPVFRAISQIIDMKGMSRVAELASHHFLSQRQFERQFKKYAGMPPKLFSRIARFHGALEKYGDKNISLTDIALECGYYDQSHFIHDFRQFSGHHPSSFFSGRSGATEWME